MSKAEASSPTGQWQLYVLECRDGALYTGISNNVARRYAAHLAGKGARYTRLNPPQRIALVHPFADKSQALKAEYAFKRLSAAAKRQLVAGGDLSDWLAARIAPPEPAQ
ncbi:GIY-YIG nuclease family protein [Aquitalea sp. LB_tupeE]|uniref:GIY-YIG nuclease family protein n=1 Tax=Aquitalea sp. LB_tupeE TaxID=2748078 RepID=UPI0015BCE6E1|nr:GIY-YIG nuclease family protein [Aquitalea sp. LB_tupeE]NWK77605.1 GIY-YIG nuclease family protein [Aquitalea sp. LB_tupeE]